MGQTGAFAPILGLGPRSDSDGGQNPENFQFRQNRENGRKSQNSEIQENGQKIQNSQTESFTELVEHDNERGITPWPADVPDVDNSRQICVILNKIDSSV